MRRRDVALRVQRNRPARSSCEEANSWKAKINLNGESVCSEEWANGGKQQQDRAADELNMQENVRSNDSPP